MVVISWSFCSRRKDLLTWLLDRSIIYLILPRNDLRGSLVHLFLAFRQVEFRQSLVNRKALSTFGVVVFHLISGKWLVVGDKLRVYEVVVRITINVVLLVKDHRSFLGSREYWWLKLRSWRYHLRRRDTLHNRLVIQYRWPPMMANWDWTYVWNRMLI